MCVQHTSGQVCIVKSCFIAHDQTERDELNRIIKKKWTVRTVLTGKVDVEVGNLEADKGLVLSMGSDAMIFSPEVEIFRDERGELMEDTVVLAVLTCAAPMITYSMEGISEREYRGMFYNRIVGMLKCAAYFGYEDLVLGAWGCGAFGNDAAIVSDLFYRTLKELDWDGLKANDLFRRIVFDVRSRGEESYNFIDLKGVLGTINCEKT